MSYLELHDIHKAYYLNKEKFPVLKGIDLNFDLGEFVSILGESGGGKSTLMNIIGGLDRKFSGSVVIGHKPLNYKDEKSLDAYRRETIGYIYQAYNLIGHLTVLDNVLISLDMTTLSRQQRNDRAHDLLKRVGLDDQSTKYPNQLSGGQKQRVAIARALASDPKVIIADEPTGALDAENTQAVLKILDEIAAEGRLVITVTHSQTVANAGTRIVHLEDGHIGKDETIRQPYPKQDVKYLQPQKLPAIVSYKTAFKHLKFNFWRNSLIIIGTAIGLFAVLLFTGLGNGISGYITNQVNALANPQVITVSAHQKTRSPSGGSPTSGAPSGGPSSTSTKQKSITDPQITKLKSVNHVTKVEKNYSLSGVTVKLDNKTTTLTSMSNWTSSVTDNTVKYGSKPKANEVIIDKSTAKKLVPSGWKKAIGKTVNFTYQTTNKSHKTVSVPFSAKVSGISDSSSSVSMGSKDYVSTSTLVSAMNKKNVPTSVTSLSVSIDKLNNVKSTTSAVNKLTINGTRVFTAVSINSMIDTVQTFIHLASNILAGIAGIALIVSALMIIVTMFMSVSARTKEIGILRAIGESKTDIRRLFISESLIIGGLSAVLAVVISYGVSALANVLLRNLANYNFVQIGLENVVIVFILAIIISLLASFLPARRAASLNPIDALSSD